MEDNKVTAKETTEEKVITVTLDGGEGCSDLICATNNIDSFMETLKTEIEESIAKMVDDDEVVEMTIRIEKKHTQHYIDNLPDWEGF